VVSHIPDWSVGSLSRDAIALGAEVSMGCGARRFSSRALGHDGWVAGFRRLADCGPPWHHSRTPGCSDLGAPG